MKLHLFFAAFVFVFTVNGQHSEDLIPKQATSVFSFNNVNLLQKISLDELISYEFMEELQHDLFDGSTAGWTLKDSGVDFGEKVNVFIGKDVQYEVTGMTFGIQHKEQLFRIFDDFQAIDSEVEGVEMYASYFNRLAVKGNTAILFRIAPSEDLVNETTDSIWFARGNDYPWYEYEWEESGEYENWDEMEELEDSEEGLEWNDTDDSEYYEWEEEEVLNEEEYIEEETTDDEQFVPEEKTYFELRDSVETAMHEEMMFTFIEALFVDGQNLKSQSPKFANQINSNSEGIFYLDNSAYFTNSNELGRMAYRNPAMLERLQELYTGNVMLGDLYIDQNTIKMRLNAEYGEALGSVYEKLSSSKFDKHILPYIHEDNTAYVTGNVNMRAAYEETFDLMMSVLNSSEAPQMAAVAMVYDLMNEFINKDALFDTYKGGMFMTYGGIQKVKIKKIVFDYDEENFEYFEREEIAEEDMPIFTYGFSTARPDIPEKILGYMTRIQKGISRYETNPSEWIKHEDYWELTNGLFESVSIYIVNKNGMFIVTNDLNLAKNNSDGFGSEAISKKKMKKAKSGGMIYAYADLNKAIAELPRELFSDRENQMLDVFRGKSGSFEMTSTKSTNKGTSYELTYRFETTEDTGTYILDLINSFYVISK